VLLQEPRRVGKSRVSWPIVATMSALLVLAVGSAGLFWSRIGQLPVDSASVGANREVLEPKRGRRLFSVAAELNPGIQEPPSRKQSNSPDTFSAAQPRPHALNARCSSWTSLPRSSTTPIAPGITTSAVRPRSLGQSLSDQRWSRRETQKCTTTDCDRQTLFLLEGFPTPYPLMAQYINERIGIVARHREHSRTYLILTTTPIDPIGFEPDHGWPCLRL